VKNAEALKDLSTLMASTVATLLLLEGVSRLFYTPPAKQMRFFSPSSQSYYEENQIVGWLPRKNLKGVHEVTGSFSTTFTTNSNGLRDREYSFSKPKGVTRIVVVGDSFTWGWGVGDDEIYTEVLESLLQGVEVINLGVGAFGTQQEMDYLKMKGMQYDPDIVILGFCLNDISESSFGKVEALKRDPSAQQLSDDPVFMKVKKFLDFHSAFYGFLADRVNTNKTLVNLLVKLKIKEGKAGYAHLDPNVRPALISYPASLTSSFEKILGILLKMKEFLAARNIRFIVVVIPSVQSVDEQAFLATIAGHVFEPNDFDLEKPYRRLEEFGRMHHIEIINPFSSLKEKHAEGSRLYLNREMHLNKLGHALLAGEICKYLTKAAHGFSADTAC
jgi:hypothetical protein